MPCCCIVNHTDSTGSVDYNLDLGMLPISSTTRLFPEGTKDGMKISDGVYG